VRGIGGWGFNRSTGADADSTAWALRFLHRAGVRLGRTEAERLGRHIDDRGRVHTFEDKATGTWAGAHDDVTPVVGLALLACGGGGEALSRVRAAVAGAQRPDGLWTSFWWASQAYASLWSVYFLRRTGGLSECAAGLLRARLSTTPLSSIASPCSLETALWLLLVLELDHPDPTLGEHLVGRLVEASDRRGWPGSPLLLVPARFEGDTASPSGPHPDGRGLLTTATACWALARWLAVGFR
jgi:hypothetical protein